jgi:outer membrane biosynthesis protein TonB
MNEDKPKKVQGTKHKQKEENKTEKKPKETKRSKSEKKPKEQVNKVTQPAKNKKSSSNKAKSDKPKEDIDRPKRSWPAFFFFQNEKRSEVKKEYPGLAQKELVSVRRESCI